MEIASEPKGLYGIVAEFKDEDHILTAANQAREAGYRRLDAYTPLPVHGLAEAIGFHDWVLPWLIFLGGVAGAVGGFGLQVYVSAIDYPLNVGNRPLISWPSFIPVTFECTILLASFAAVFGMIILNGLPRPHHPIFNAPNFERASQDSFFLCIEATDPRFDPVKTTDFLQGLGAHTVSAVEH